MLEDVMLELMKDLIAIKKRQLANPLIICADCGGKEYESHAHHWYIGGGRGEIVICEPCSEERDNDIHILNSEDSW